MTAPPLIVDIMMSRFGREYELCALVGRLAAAPDLVAAIRALEQGVPPLVTADDATFVSGARERADLGHMLVQPLGTRAAIVVRRPPHAPPFGPVEAATLAAVASSVSPRIEQLFAAR